MSNFFVLFPQKYLNPLKSPENAGIVDAQIVDEIFFMVPAILNTHERFLDELRRRLDSWDPLQKVGDAFFEVVRIFFVFLKLNSI
jgi:Rho guanine nucleotide exchange factor 17